MAWHRKPSFQGWAGYTSVVPGLAAHKLARRGVSQSGQTTRATDGTACQSRSCSVQIGFEERGRGIRSICYPAVDVADARPIVADAGLGKALKQS